MKKLFIALLVLLTLTGCKKSNTANLDQEKVSAYLSYYSAILEEDHKLSQSQNFDIEIVVNKLSENSYRYDVIIDNPKVAMYNIKAMAVIDEIGSMVNTDKMMPSVGIFEDSNLNLVPFQLDVEHHYVQGIILSVDANRPALNLGVMVDYLDSSKTNYVREYLSLYGAYQETGDSE